MARGRVLSDDDVVLGTAFRGGPPTRRKFVSPVGDMTQSTSQSWFKKRPVPGVVWSRVEKYEYNVPKRNGSRIR